MRFLNATPFLEFIKRQPVPKVLLLIASDPFEKKKLIDTVFPDKASMTLSRFNTSAHSVNKVVEALDSPFLLGGEPQVVYEDVEVLKKNDVDKLLALFARDFVGTLLLSAANKKTLQTLIKEIDKRGIVLDLAGEKIWEKEKRFSDFIRGQCTENQKRIEEKGIRLLIERSHRELAYLSNEIEKLITYVGTRELITEHDVRSIGTSLQQETVWKLAEKIVWEQKEMFSLMGELPIDSTFFHTLIVALRYQYQLGLKFASLKDVQPGQYANQLSKQPPWIVEKRTPQAQKMGIPFFQKALKELFSIDLLSKNQVQDYASLLALFEGKMQPVGNR